MNTRVRAGIFARVSRGGCLALLGLLLATAGCRTVKPIYNADAVTTSPDASVRLQPGDELAFKFFYSSDLNEEQVIRPDGKVALQLVGDVQAAGRTPGELQTELAKLYANKLEKPDVSVAVKKFSGRLIFVGGAVKEPGQFEMAYPFTAIEAVMKAKGFEMETAEFQNVVVIRNENGRYAGYGINFKDTLAGQMGKPFYLKPGDLVFVPKTRIANMNTWIEQHITKMIPQIGLPVFFQVN